MCININCIINPSSTVYINIVRRRDERLAQRGILTIEDQIREAEEQNTRLKNRLNNQANKNIDTSITNFNEVRTNTQIEFKDRTPLYYKLVSINVISK